MISNIEKKYNDLIKRVLIRIEYYDLYKKIIHSIK